MSQAEGEAGEAGEGGEGGEAGSAEGSAGEEGGEALCVREAAARGALPAAPLLAAALRLHADLGDVQTAAAVCLALHDHR